MKTGAYARAAAKVLAQLRKLEGKKTGGYPGSNKPGKFKRATKKGRK